MKKKLFAIILSFGMILGMAGCGQEVSQDELQEILNGNSEFVENHNEAIDDITSTQEVTEPTVELNPDFDITDIDLDPQSFTDAEFGWMTVLDGNSAQLLAMSGELDQYVGQWVNFIDICPIEIDEEIMYDSFYLEYYFDTIPDTEAAKETWNNGDGDYIDVVGFLMPISNSSGTLQDYALLDCRVVDGIVGGDTTEYDDYYRSPGSDPTISDTSTSDTYLLSSIIDEYYSNMAAFAQKYEGKTIIMDGVTIGQIDFADTLWVNLENGDIAVCSADVSEIAKIEVGRTYNIIGTFDLYADMQFTLNDCTFELVG